MRVYINEKENKRKQFKLIFIFLLYNNESLYKCIVI